MIWTLVHGGWDGNQTHGPRGITWTLGDWDEASCSFINPKVWLGYPNAGNGDFAASTARPARSSRTLLAPNWQGSGYAPYGGALDPQQRPWFTGLRGELMRDRHRPNPISSPASPSRATSRPTA
jgi:hypothetical protein